MSIYPFSIHLFCAKHYAECIRYKGISTELIVLWEINVKQICDVIERTKNCGAPRAALKPMQRARVG